MIAMSDPQRTNDWLRTQSKRRQVL
eukprot:COSAG01_NODE_42449_length_440_cov_0.604106_2_plen_24_part_01